MYSIVLLAAMTSGGDVADCHRGGCGGGCSGLSRGCGGCGGLFNRGCGGGCGGRLFGGHRRHHGCGGNGCGGYSNGCCGAAPVADCCAPVVASCGCTGGAVVTEEAAKEEKEEGGDDEEMKKDEEGRLNAPAKLIVSVPAKAKLTIDGTVTKSASARRVFVSPTLNAGKTYTYTLQATIEVAGETQTVTKTVEVRAGKTTQIELKVEAAVASR